jgi:hypothetical protein
MTPQPNQRGRLVAIFTGAVSVVIGLLYLGLMVVLDSRGPLQPPPPEALGISVIAPGPDRAAPSAPDGVAAADPAAAAVPPPG